MVPESTAVKSPAAADVLHKARILLADDQPDVLQALRLLLKAEGCEIDTATSPAGVLAAVDARDFDVAIIDLNYTRDTTSGLEGLSLLSKLQALDTPMPVVVMTAWGTVDLAVGYFPAVLLDGHLHVDGSVMGNFLTLLDLEQFRALAARLRELGAGAVTVRVWAILNVFPHAAIKVMPPEKATSMALRSTYLLYWAQQPELLRGPSGQPSAQPSN